MDRIINFGLLREPLNWVTVFLMLAIGSILLGLLSSTSTESNVL